MRDTAPIWRTRGLQLVVATVGCLVWGVSGGPSARAIGDTGGVEIRTLQYAGRGAARPSAIKRLAWALRQRTSIEARLQPGTVRLDSPALYDSPFVYWSGLEPFAALSDAEVTGLRRFVEFGGSVLIDDGSGDADGGFGRSVERALARAFGPDALRPLPGDHTIYRSFYLIERPLGRVSGPPHLDAVVRDGRAAVVFSRHDLGGAWARDNLGNYLHAVSPGGSRQREMAYRLGVNIVMYALCLDYKDDQVHSPFIMRRRAGRP